MATANINHTITGGNLTSGQGDLWIYSASGSTGINNGNGNPRAASYSATIASTISGDISLSVGGGTSQLRLTGNNTYTGGTFLQNGLISINADSALGASSGTVTAVSGVNNIQTTSNFSFNSSRNFVINSGAYLGFGDNAGGRTNTIGGQISGGGQLAIGFVSNAQRLILTGDNTAFTGQYLVNGYLRADEGTGLSSNANLTFRGRGPGFVLGVLETSGSFTRSLGSGAGQVQWQADGQYGSGGFAAVGGALNVNLGGNVTPDTLTWGSGYFLPGSGQELILGSAASTHDVTFQNSIALNGVQRGIRVTANGTTKAILSGTLSGNATSGINKQGTGTLVLTGDNTYQGTTTVTAGTLQIGDGTTDGSISSSSGITNNATLVYNLIGSQSYNNAIGGTGSLTKSGTGTLTLGGSNTYTGLTTVSGGALRLGSANALSGGIGTAGGTSALTFNGGVLGLGNGDFTRSLASAGTATGVNFTGSGGWFAYGADRTVNLGGSGASVTWATANTGFNGQTLILGHADGTHTVDLQNALDLGASTRTVQVGDGSAAVDAKLSGNITSSGGGLTKTGAGTLLLSGNNTYTGATVVNLGQLAVGSSGRLNVGNNSTMSVTGSNSTGSATLTFQDSGSLSGTDYTINVGNAANARAVLNIKDSSSITLNGTATGTNILSVGSSQASGAGAVVQSGGDVSVSNQLFLGVVGSGYYNMSGGNLTLSGATGNSARFRIGQPVAGALGVFQQSGGAISYNTGFGLGIVDSPGAGAAAGYGTYYMTGGSLTGNLTAGTGALSVGNRNGQGDFTLAGGTVNVGVNAVTLGVAMRLPPVSSTSTAAPCRPTTSRRDRAPPTSHSPAARSWRMATARPSYKGSPGPTSMVVTPVERSPTPAGRRSTPTDGT